MSQIWIAIGAVIAVAAVVAPLMAIVLVSIASRREESAQSLKGQAPGAITGAARRLLAYRGDRAAPASRRSAGQAPGTHSEPDLEVRFGHARRPVPAARQYPASRQPQPRPVGIDQRQGAGV
jgi:hypothetical protein